MFYNKTMNKGKAKINGYDWSLNSKRIDASNSSNDDDGQRGRLEGWFQGQSSGTRKRKQGNSVGNALAIPAVMNGIAAHLSPKELARIAGTGSAFDRASLRAQHDIVAKRDRLLEEWKRARERWKASLIPFGATCTFLADDLTDDESLTIGAYAIVYPAIIPLIKRLQLLREGIQNDFTAAAYCRLFRTLRYTTTDDLVRRAENECDKIMQKIQDILNNAINKNEIDYFADDADIVTLQQCIQTASDPAHAVVAAHRQFLHVHMQMMPFFRGDDLWRREDSFRKNYVPDGETLFGRDRPGLERALNGVRETRSSAPTFRLHRRLRDSLGWTRPYKDEWPRPRPPE